VKGQQFSLTPDDGFGLEDGVIPPEIILNTVTLQKNGCNFWLLGSMNKLIIG
jgi:hypothetical protein